MSSDSGSSFADERLAGTDIRAYVIPGNDDPWSIDEVLASGSGVVACDERVEMVGPHEMVSFGYSNRTPWHTPRELDEEDIYARLERLVEQLEDPGRAIFNIHVPPYESSLDTAFEVDEELRYVTKGGRPHEVATGSQAVRQIIEETQPLAQPARSHPREQRCDDNRSNGGNQPRFRLR